MTVAGRVVGVDGDPVAGARVDGFANGGLTDAKGDFVLRGPVRREGVKVRIRASADGFLPTDPEEFLLQPGGDPTNVLLRFTIRAVPIRGRVVDGDGEPVAGAWVTLRPVNPPVAPASTTISLPDGSFRFEARPGTEWSIEARGDGFAPATLPRVLAGDPLPDLVLRPAPAPEPK